MEMSPKRHEKFSTRKPREEPPTSARRVVDDELGLVRDLLTAAEAARVARDGCVVDDDPACVGSRGIEPVLHVGDHRAVRNPLVVLIRRTYAYRLARRHREVPARG